MFRAAEDAEASARALFERGFEAAPAPATEIAATGAEPPAQRFDFVVATSAKAFVHATPAVIAAARDLPLHVVGEKTAETARLAGLAAQTIAPDVAALIAALDGLAGRALYLAGRDRRPELETALGPAATPLVVYEARARESWGAEEIDAVSKASAALHYSARGAALAVELARAAGLSAAFARMPHVCLSARAADPLRDSGAKRVLWPAAPDEPHLFDTLETAIADARLNVALRRG